MGCFAPNKAIKTNLCNIYSSYGHQTLTGEMLYMKTRAVFQKIRFKINLLTTDLSQVRYFLVFLGNPRSGTTLVRSLLDAHPNIAIANEAHTIQLMKAGKSWQEAVRTILANSSRFGRNPTWNNYSYRLPNYATSGKKRLTVIGDKRAGGTTKALMEEPALLFQLFEWSEVPVRFINCVRHPYDVIATKTRRNKLTVEYNCQRYFDLEKGVEQLFSLLGRSCKRIYHEELIANPNLVLQDLLQFLGVRAEQEYLKACQALIFDKPHQSRFKIEWTQEAKAKVEREALLREHLSYYLDDGKLLFDEAPTETTG